MNLNPQSIKNAALLIQEIPCNASNKAERRLTTGQPAI